MTLIGAWVDQHSAFLWADTEFYLRSDAEPSPHEIPGMPLGHNRKLFLNELAGVAAVGAGDLGGNRHIKAAVDFADSFDALAVGLPAYLKQAANWRFEAVAEHPDWICIAAGWSRRLGRILSAKFDAPRCEAQYSAVGFAQPYLSEFEGLFPSDPADILGLAQSQMRVIKDSHPLAGTGSLLVAQIRREGIAVTAFDLPSGRCLPGIPADLQEVGPPMSRSYLLEQHT